MLRHGGLPRRLRSRGRTRYRARKEAYTTATAAKRLLQLYAFLTDLTFISFYL